MHQLGPLRCDIEREFNRRIEKRGVLADGNVYLRELADYWKSAHPLVKPLKDLDDIEQRARWLGEQSRKFGIEHTCESWDLPYPPGSPDARQNRGEDYQYWRRVLRRMVARWWDQFMRLAGFVHKRKQIYASDQAVRWHRQRLEANRRTLADLLAISNQGDVLSLLEVVERSVANPEHRFIEAMVRIRGMDEWAQENGWIGMMATVTCPSRFHARHMQSGQLNKKYDGSTPRQGNDYLLSVVGRIRSKLDREGIPWKGFRVVEPHHDGCPHTHILIFCQLDHIRAVESVFRRYAMAESPHEAGARKHRLKFERIDRAKGDAASYVAKYIAKSLDGKGIEQDLFGNEGEWAALRVVAWARTWGIRQFAFYGNGEATVTLYREYRRIREEDAPIEPHRSVWDACNRYRWCEFMRRQFRALPARLVRSDALKRDKYGDPLPDGLKPIIGIEIGPVSLPTRIKQWTTQRGPKHSGAALPDAAGFGPWTRVSNRPEPPERGPP